MFDNSEDFLWDYWVFNKVYYNKDIFDDEEDELELPEDASLEDHIREILEPLENLMEEWSREEEG